MPKFRKKPVEIEKQNIARREEADRKWREK